jgi:hypothetical protein
MKPKSALFLLLLSLAFVVMFCSRDRLGPEPQAPSDEPIGEASIGATGGRIVADDFILQVPAGSFTSERTLRLYRDTSENPFSDRTASDMFRIEGLPREYGSPIALSTRLTEDAPVKIALGERIFRHGADATETAWRFLDGRDSSGWCLWALAPPEISGKMSLQDSSSAPPLQVTTATDNGEYTTSAGHFKITYPVGTVTIEQTVALGGHLEDAFTDYSSLGFACSRSWPVSVTVHALDANLFGGWNASGWGVDACGLEFNSLHIASPDMRVTVGHEIFHMFQYFYDPRSPWDKASKGGPTYWLDEATAAWSEAKFASASGTFVSATRSGNELNPLAGISAGAIADAAAHGYGMSSLIRALVERQGNEGFLLPTYTKIRGGMGVIPALQQSLSSPLSQRWGPYLVDLVGGGIYGDVTGDMARDNRSGMFTVASAADTAASFSASYPDLSGRLYAVRLNSPQIGGNATLVARVEGLDKRIAAYRYEQNQALTLLAEDPDSVIVTDLRTMQTQGAWVIILVANSYASNAECDGARPLTLQMRVLDLPDLSMFHLGSVNLTYRADWGGGNIVPRQDLLISTSRGHFQGNLFVAEWDSIDTSNGVRFKGHIYGTLNLADLSLHDWSAENRWTYPTPDTYNLYQASGTRIPLSQRLYGFLSYSIVGTGACGAITDIVVTQVSDGVVTRNLAGHSCTSESSITVRFMGDSIGTYPR